mgnify:FL=1
MRTLHRRLQEQVYWVQPTLTLIGKDETGAWKTAHAKEYPKRMSCGIANAMLDEAVRHPASHEDKDMLKAIQAMGDYMPQLTEDLKYFGQDCVDEIKPVHHVTTKWEPFLEFHEEVNVRFHRF